MRFRIERLEERIALYGDGVFEIEPNGTIEQADEVGAVEKVQRRGILTGAEDVDFLAFDLVEGLDASVSAAEALFVSQQSRLDVNSVVGYTRWNPSLEKHESDFHRKFGIDEQTLTISRLFASASNEILNGPPNANARIAADATWLEQTQGTVHFSAELTGQEYRTDGRINRGSAGGAAHWKYSFFSPRQGEITFDFTLGEGARMNIEASSNTGYLRSGRLDASQGSTTFSLAAGYSEIRIDFYSGGSVDDVRRRATIDWNLVLSSDPIRFDLIKPDGSVHAEDIDKIIDFEADVSGTWYLQTHQNSAQDVHYHVDIERELVGRLNAAWLVHGFNMNFLTESGRSDFIRPWEATYTDAVFDQLNRPEKNEYAFVDNFEWDSSSDWGLALAAYALKEAFSKVEKASTLSPATKVLANVAADFFDQVAELSLKNARLKSENASKALANEIEDVLESLPDNLAGGSVTLIGHSRGGEVVSRAAALLRKKYGSIPQVNSQVILLDGLGTDWPGPGKQLASYDPSKGCLGVDVNVRVEKGLLEDLLNSPAGADFFRRAVALWSAKDIDFSQPLSAFADRLSDIEPWKAPSRSMVNRLVAGTNHVNIDDHFFGTGGGLLSSLLNTNDTRCSGGEGESGDPISIDEFIQLRDADFQALISHYKNSIGSLTVDDLPEGFRGYYELLSATESWLSRSWSKTGDVKLDLDSEKVTLAGNRSELRQAITIPPGENTLTFKGLELIGETTSLDVFFDDLLVGTAFYGGDITLAATNPTQESLVGEIVLRLSADEGGTARFSSVAHNEQTDPIAGELISTANGLAIRVPTTPFAGYDDVQFYWEANSVYGLQVGSGGDSEAMVSVDGTDFMIENSGTFHTQRLYAAYTLGNGSEIFRQISISTSLRSNFDNPLDTSGDGFVSPIDVLLVVNRLNDRSNASRIPDLFDRLVDVNVDGFVSPLDALIVINHLNQSSEAEGESPVDDKHRNVDSILLSLEFYLDEIRKRSVWDTLS